MEKQDRQLPATHRRRLRCLAASSGHAASLEAALAHAGCKLTSDTLTSAAAAGNLAACQRLLDEGCWCTRGALLAAAGSGNLELLQLLLKSDTYVYSPCRNAAAAAASAGQVELFERLLPADLLDNNVQCAKFDAVAAAAATAAAEAAASAAAAAEAGSMGEGAAEKALAASEAAVRAAEAAQKAHEAEECVRRQRNNRSAMLEYLLTGCPAEVVARYYHRLWLPPPAQQLEAAAAAGEGGAQAARAADEAADFMVYWLLTSRDLLAAALRSPTPCWLGKVRFLLSAWGPTVARQVVGLREQQPGNGAARHVTVRMGLRECDQRCGELLLQAACHQPELLARFRLAHADGLTSGGYRGALLAAAERGDVAAIAHLLDDGGGDGRVPLGPLDSNRRWVADSYLGVGHVAVLQLLAQRGYRFTAEDVAQEAFEQLDRRQSGSEEALEWAAAELEAETGARPKPIRGVAARAVLDSANEAAAGWLQRAGLLPTEEQYAEWAARGDDDEEDEEGEEEDEEEEGEHEEQEEGEDDG
ncbi:hypothetical protein HYH02_002592 [Chlamydomonas schloesseri]|uniref:Uncharacterized protein n=1 Tax=Chlamydomonas schloesseri TaxID=2026947 RepID=A0A835WSA6_9CHLO|nr:hypothetical protein HYH02_002592 [Chlamydomonas schloesseri]|eukprot:KAG2453269.1 hypothetical protein HYH02_002592 [Chlamydomonas schloesseri]